MARSKVDIKFVISDQNDSLRAAIALATGDEPCDRRVFVIAFGEARRRQGLSLEQLAETTGLSLAHLTRIEMGDHSIAPEEQTILATVLKVPVAMLERLGPCPELELHSIPLEMPVLSPGVLIPWPSRADLRPLQI